MHLAVSSCVCCRIRSHEGAGLTIRIPRHYIGGSTPLCSPPSTHARTHTPANVSKSKSLTTSMDKLMQHHQTGSNEVTRPCSRGSTPSTRRITPSRQTRTPPRTPEIDDRSSHSPCGSEISLHSCKSNGSSLSAKSAKSSSSAKSAESAKSSGSGRKSACARRSADADMSPGKPRSLSASAVRVETRKGRKKSATTTTTTTTTTAATTTTTTIAATHRRKGDCGMANGEGGGSSSSSSSRRTTPPPRSGPGTPTRHSTGGMRKPLPVFNSYMSLFQVQEKLKKGEVIEGVLRINPKNYEDAYITAPDGEMDIYIGGVPDRNGALNGDLVAVEIYPTEHWKVLYDVLDEYLENNPLDRALVYGRQQQQQQQQDTTTTTTTATTTASATPTTTTTTTTTATTKIHKLTVAEKLSSTLHISDVLLPKPQLPSLPQGSIGATGVSGSQGGVQGSLGTTGRDVQGAQMTTGALELAKGDLHQGDSDVLVEEDDRKKRSKNRRRRGRGKKKGKRREEVGVDEVEDSLSTSSNPPKALIHNQSSDSLLERPQDELFLLDHPSLSSPSLPPGASQGGFEGPEGKGEGSAKPSRAVAPDQLSECESTDDESDASEILNYEQVREDQAFFEAQWQATYGTQAPHGHSATGGGPQGATPTHTTTGDPGTGGANIATTGTDRVRTCPGLSRSQVTGSGQGKVKVTHTQTYPKPKDAGKKTEAARKGGLNQTPRRTPAHTQTMKPDNAKDMGPQGGAPQGRQGPQGRTTPRKYPHKRTEPTVSQVTRLKDWSKFVQRTGSVIHILDQKHTRLAAGTIRPFPDQSRTHALFAPVDHRVPRMKIPAGQLPNDFFARHSELYKHKLYLCRLAQWTEPKYALGDLVREIGQSGDIEVETQALLLENAVDLDPFPSDAIQDLPTLPWTIPKEEIELRHDLRDECIFTIDPESARDLDDALSCRPLPSGQLKIGVHIADVTYFVRQGSALDRVALSRATSVYMPDRVIPMLPRGLCEGLCSLLPGSDRLAMSVIWHMDPQGNITDEWFGRTVIRSCAKLTYGQAQDLIDGGLSSLEGCVQDPHSAKDVVSKVLQLYRISRTLRKGRFETGALHLHQPKLAFTLRPGEPPEFASESKEEEAHHLVEEFMLLANMAAAERTFTAFPNQCLLRRHPPPLPGPMQAVTRTLAMAGVMLDSSTAGSLQRTLLQYQGTISLALASLCSKPMQNALYFSPQDETPHSHYALNVDRYTHFTSPIRRYADIIVHRLLASTLAHPDAIPILRGPKLAQACQHCNDRKKSAKSVQETASELWLGLIVRHKRILVQPGMVVQILDRSIDVLLLNFGVVRRVYMDPLPLSNVQYEKTSPTGSSLTLHWSPDSNHPARTQRLALLSCVQVALLPGEETSLRFNTQLQRP